MSNLSKEKLIDYIRACISESECKVCPDDVKCGERCIATVARTWLDMQEEGLLDENRGVHS